MGRFTRLGNGPLTDFIQSREKVSDNFLDQTQGPSKKKFFCSCEFFLFFRALMNILNSYSYLMEVDVLLVRSCLYLFLVDELKEFLDNINVELLDVLNIFTFKIPQDIYYTNFQVIRKLLKRVRFDS